MADIMEITAEELVEHIEDDDFFRVYGNPVRIIAGDNRDCILISIELYERLFGKEKELGKRLYTFKDKDITMNMCVQIRDVVNVIQKRLKIDFEEACMLFYKSKTYKVLQNTENALWAESAEYIADRFFEEKG